MKEPGGSCAVKNCPWCSSRRESHHELFRELGEALDKLHRARQLWCDSRRDQKTGYVDGKYLDEFENAIRGKP